MHVREKTTQELDQILTKEFLIKNYINKKFSLKEIAVTVGCDRKVIRKRLVRFGIPLRSISEAVRGVPKHTKESKLKISKALKGIPKPVGFKEKLRKALTGKKHSKEACLNKSKALIGKMVGKKHWNWQGGITPLLTKIRTSLEYSKWVGEIFERDNYKCQECGRGGDIEAHHIKEFSKIFKEFLQLYNQFSLTEDKEVLFKLAIKYTPFWDINNGKTLCLVCHAKTYKKEKNVNP